ncbi:ribose 5-phosphate isomerase B [Methanobrevibacter sp.]|jgi:ribose 5-phosphate isomerase B|uniref:ribose 5-phosphate isomerase B n=1 Tax=Methanobrevibacter sp. TaxID=66852 RepID=UPI003890C3CE
MKICNFASSFINSGKMEHIIPIASDHGGFEMKEFLIGKLKEAGYMVKDFGTYSNESVDYPDMIHPLASAIEHGEYPLGIILCGSGNGAQMTANHHHNVRAALCWNVELAKLARQHNDANILALPGRFIPNELAWEMVQVFLSTDFEGGRHTKRVEKIEPNEKDDE